jgi:hypothetical protein
MRYKIGDLVLVTIQVSFELPHANQKDGTVRLVYEIDGVTEKVVGGNKVIRYESGDHVFLETDVEGKVILEKPRAPRTRKKKVVAEESNSESEDN